MRKFLEIYMVELDIKCDSSCKLIVFKLVNSLMISCYQIHDLLCQWF